MGYGVWDIEYRIQRGPRFAPQTRILFANEFYTKRFGFKISYMYVCTYMYMHTSIHTHTSWLQTRLRNSFPGSARLPAIIVAAVMESMKLP